METLKMQPSMSLQLRRLLLGLSRSTSFSFISYSPLHPLPPPPLPSQLPSSIPSSRNLLISPSLFTTRHFSSEPSTSTQTRTKVPDPIALSLSLSSELIKDPDSDPVSVSQRLHLSFSHIIPNPNLVLQTLNLSHEAGRSVLGFHQWLISNPKFTYSDETLSYFIHYFGRRKDFKATHDLLATSSARSVSGPETLDATVDRLVRVGRPTRAVQFFERMETDYALKRDCDSMKVIVEKLCEKGFASYAERMVKDLAKEFFPYPPCFHCNYFPVSCVFRICSNVHH